MKEKSFTKNLKDVLFFGGKLLEKEFDFFQMDKILRKENALYRLDEFNLNQQWEQETINFDEYLRPSAYNSKNIEPEQPDYKTTFKLKTNWKPVLQIWAVDLFLNSEKEKIFQNLIHQVFRNESLSFYDEIRSFYHCAATYVNGSNSKIIGNGENEFKGDDNQKKEFREKIKKQIYHLDKSKIENYSTEEMEIGKFPREVESLITKIRCIFDKYTTFINRSLIRVFVSSWTFRQIKYSLALMGENKKESISISKEIEGLELDGVKVIEETLLGNEVQIPSEDGSKKYDLTKIEGVVFVTKKIPNAMGRINITEVRLPFKTCYEIGWQSGVEIDPNLYERIIVLTNLPKNNYKL